MLRLTLRGITRSALPHPWFDLDHPMMKADPQIMKMIKNHERKGTLVLKPELDMSLEEYNKEPVELYEMTDEHYNSDPPVMDMLKKLYAHYEPLKILREAESLPSFEFNTKIQQLEKFDYNYSYQEMNDAEVIDSRFVISRFAPPKFKKLVDIFLSKMPIYGSVVPMEDNEKHIALNSAFDKEFYTFFFGEGAFFDDHEKKLFRRFLMKQMMNNQYLDNREITFITEAEDNFILGMINWPGSDDHEYRCFYKPYFTEYILEKEMWQNTVLNFFGKINKNLWMKSYYK